ncbi:MAG: hypothetical protein LBD23_12490 [Oscillospiraceae bacterium]|nr:hypothetical protein [Oscillospiraceae bacterium]
MNVGRVANINNMAYVAAAERLRPPVARQASSVMPQNNAAITNIMPTRGNNTLFLSLDGDRAEISNRARGLSFIDFNPVAISFGADMYTNKPSGKIPADLSSGVQAPEISGNEMLEELKSQGVCHTCENRKYVDQSDDASVSFQTPTNINPNMAAAAVASHENEHVRNEQAKAARDGREIVNQTVTLTYDSCPECGKHYVSGGTTKTTSISKSKSQNHNTEIEPQVSNTSKLR